MGDDSFIRGVRAAVAVLLGLAWVVAVGIGLYFSFKSGDDPSWVTGDGMKYFMPGLTALMGGVVAAAFGVPTQDPNQSGSTQRLAAVVEGRRFGDEKTRLWVGRLYIIAYLILGGLAAITWIVKGADAIEYVRTLAPAWGGLVIAIGMSFVSTD